MFNLSFTPPTIVEAQVWSRLPDNFRNARQNDWALLNKPGQEIDSFIEGPAFDAQGNLYVCDIPYGRIFRITSGGAWSLITQYDGWPNGLAIDAANRIWIADHRRGLLRLDPETAKMETILEGPVEGKPFKGLNDLTFTKNGDLYFTDQGQTGLHDPTGRVYCMTFDGELVQVLHNVASPNGLAFDMDERFLHVAATRSNNIWRMPIFEGPAASKANAFQTFFGTSGPDGLAFDGKDGLYVAHASLRGAFRLNPLGELTHYIKSPLGTTVTNIAFVPGEKKVVMTESSTGTILIADVPETGKPLFASLPGERMLTQ